MNYYFEKKGKVLCVYLFGIIQNDEYIELQKEVVKRIDEERIKQVLVILRELKLLVSFGLKFFISLKNKIESLNGQLKFAEFPPQAKSTMDLTRLSDMFEIFNSEEEALKSFR